MIGMSMNKLLLASSSATRHKLLKEMDIPFEVIKQAAHEVVDAHLNLEQATTLITQRKMEHVIMPLHLDNATAFVVTADSMCQDARGVIHGKPTDKNDAIAKIKALRGQGLVGTAFCLDKKKYANNRWSTVTRIERYVQASYVFDMPDRWIEQYLAHMPHYLTMSGGVTIEGYGAQFLKSINGSYSTILGLPVFELRESLEEIGFFADTTYF
jgi:septum formation protein